jgi:hypothetical protein
MKKFLVLSLFACIPDRQRTFRELELGKTLFKKQGSWLILHGPDDYKTGKIYGERPPLVIAEYIHPYLEEYLTKWRSAFNPNHNFVFTKSNGEIPDHNFIYRIVTSTTYNLTGKK